MTDWQSLCLFQKIWVKFKKTHSKGAEKKQKKFGMSSEISNSSTLEAGMRANQKEQMLEKSNGGSKGWGFKKDTEFSYTEVSKSPFIMKSETTLAFSFSAGFSVAATNASKVLWIDFSALLLKKDHFTSFPTPITSKDCYCSSWMRVRSLLLLSVRSSLVSAAKRPSLKAWTVLFSSNSFSSWPHSSIQTHKCMGHKEEHEASQIETQKPQKYTETPLKMEFLTKFSIDRRFSWNWNYKRNSFYWLTNRIRS